MTIHQIQIDIRDYNNQKFSLVIEQCETIELANKRANEIRKGIKKANLDYQVLVSVYHLTKSK